MYKPAAVIKNQRNFFQKNYNLLNHALPKTREIIETLNKSRQERNCMPQ